MEKEKQEAFTNVLANLEGKTKVGKIISQNKITDMETVEVSACCKANLVEDFKDNPRDHHDLIEIYTCEKCKKGFRVFHNTNRDKYYCSLVCWESTQLVDIKEK